MSDANTSMVSPITVEAHDEVSVSSEDGFPRLNVDEAVDQLQVMLLRERTKYPSPRNYMLPRTSASSTDVVTESWRRRICEWIFEVVDHFTFDREVVAVALDYLDRSVSLISESSDKPMTKREFQLFAVTSLYMAIKLHGETDAPDGRRLKLKISAFEELSRGLFKVAHIEAMERRIVDLLKWQLNPPTAAQYVAYFVRLLPEWSPGYGEPSFARVASRIYDVAKYLTELACFNSAATFAATPSMVAYASVLCAIESLSNSMPLPKHLFSTYLNNISEATSSTFTTNENIGQVQQILRDLAPAMFETTRPHLVRVVSLLGHETSESRQKARDSPVSVCVDAESTQRKRARTG